MTLVANRTIDNKQCTFLWYVNDIKISHADSQVVDSILEDLRIAYGK